MATNLIESCRLCLQSGIQTFDIFTSHYAKKNISYADMISRCTKLKPHQHDGLPSQICKECSKQLKKCFAFNNKCEESDTKLREHLRIFGSKLPVHDDSKLTQNDVISDQEEDAKPDFTDTEIDIVYNEVKPEINTNEEVDDKDQNADLFTTLLQADSRENKQNEQNVKLETELLNGADDDCWDADDDIILTRLGVKETLQNNEENEETKPKKKRGRKRKVSGEERLAGSKVPHQCDICGKFLSTRSNLKQHKICHTDLRPFKCTLCYATFKGHSALFQHSKKHTGETPYHCEYCPKQFSRRSGLVNHIRMHTGEKKFGCDICFKSFTQSAQLSIHMKRHKGDKPFLCQDCGKGFPIKADLKVHQRIHNGEKPYACHLCTKTFATSGNLSIHIRIHNKEIRYNCKECHRGFVTCSAYNVHLKRHKGQRDYSCDCGKTFYTSSALKQHKVVHTGEKKYQCKICDRKFTQTSHLSRHFKRDHAKPNAPVPSSDYYKIIVHDDNIFTDNTKHGHTVTHMIHANVNVKCEQS